MMNEPQYGIGDLPAAGTVKDTDSSAICQNPNGCFAADPSVTMQRVTQYQLASYYRSRLTVAPPLIYDSSSGLFSLATDSTLRVNGGQLSVVPIALTGDVTGGGLGTITTTVARLAGTPLAATPPTLNQVLAYNGTQWAPATGGTGTGSGTVGSGTGPQIAQYAVGTGTTVGGATISGDATIAQGGTLTVTGLQGHPVSSTAPSATNQVLQWSGTQWAPTALAAGGTVTSLTAGVGITLTPNPIIGAGTIALTSPVTIANGGTNAATAPAALTSLGAVPAAGGTMTGTLTMSGAAPQISITNATSNYILLGAGGTGPPTVATRSVGTKLVLYPQVPTIADYAIGVDSGELWFSGTNHAWFNSSATKVMAIDNIGNLTSGGGFAAGNNASAMLNLYVGAYTAVYAPDGSGQTGAILVGNAGAARTFHANTSHQFLDRTGVTTWATINSSGLTLTTPLAIASGGTGAAIAATSGGIPYFSSTTAMGSSGALTQYGVVLGGGAGAAPTVTAAGTTGQVLTANTGAAPTWQPAAGGGNVSTTTLTTNAFVLGSGVTSIASSTLFSQTTAGLLLNNNTTTPTPPGNGINIVIQGSDTAAGNNRINIYSNTANGGSGSLFNGINYRGTAAVKTASLQNDGLVELAGYGTGTTSGGGGAIDIKAAENWAAGAGGTYMTFSNTTPLTTTLVERVRIGQGLTVDTSAGALPTGGDLGAGTINAATGMYVNGTALGLTGDGCVSAGWLAGANPQGATIFVNNTGRQLSVQAITGVPEILQGGAATADVYSAASGTAIAGSTKISTSSLNMNVSAGTTQSMLSAAVNLANGSRLLIQTTGAWTAGVGSITVYLQ